MSPAKASEETVSVALCTRNGARFIGDQLDSIFTQTRMPDQIVISDDASTDDTLDEVGVAVARFRLASARDLDVVILENAKPLGVAANFEQAIAACSGSFIALSDQDDVWTPGRVERVLAEFHDRDDLLLVHTNATLIDDNGHSLGATLFEALDIGSASISRIHAGAAMSLLLRRNFVTGATTMIRRRLFETARPVPAPWVHDEWLGVVAAALGGVDILDEPLIGYRQHAANEIGVVKLGVRGKFRRMREPGVLRNKRLLDRAQVFAMRFDKLGDLVPAVYRDAVHRKLAHEEVRSSLAANRLLRWPQVIRELSTGRYSEFGRGALDALRDLIQPLTTSR